MHIGVMHCTTDSCFARSRFVVLAERKDQQSGLRTVRSFVRRTGRLTASQARALRELWPKFGVDITTGPLDLDTLFGRSAPVVFEIGFGNGDTLVADAQDNPDMNFLGVEVHEPGIGHCLLAAERAGIENLRLVARDALEVLADQLQPAALDRINLYFPDPWPKKRHHKRRIVQPEFLRLCASRLRAGGLLCIATDWANYAEYIDELIAESEDFECVAMREHRGDRPLDRRLTKFERRGLAMGHRIRDWQLRKL